MISLRPLQEPDISIIKSWPSYPAEFSGLDYALRDRGWLDEYVGKKGTEIFVAEDSGTLVGFSILTCEKGGSAEFRIALHPEWVGHGLGKTITRLTLPAGFFPSGHLVNPVNRPKNKSPGAKSLYLTLFSGCWRMHGRDPGKTGGVLPDDHQPRSVFRGG